MTSSRRFTLHPTPANSFHPICYCHSTIDAFARPPTQGWNKLFNKSQSEDPIDLIQQRQQLQPSLIPTLTHHKKVAYSFSVCLVVSVDVVSGSGSGSVFFYFGVGRCNKDQSIGESSHEIDPCWSHTSSFHALVCPSKCCWHNRVSHTNCECLPSAAQWLSFWRHRPFLWRSPSGAPTRPDQPKTQKGGISFHSSSIAFHFTRAPRTRHDRCLSWNERTHSSLWTF